MLNNEILNLLKNYEKIFKFGSVMAKNCEKKRITTTLSYECWLIKMVFRVFLRGYNDYILGILIEKHEIHQSLTLRREYVSKNHDVSRKDTK